MLEGVVTSSNCLRNDNEITEEFLSITMTGVVLQWESKEMTIKRYIGVMPRYKTVHTA